MTHLLRTLVGGAWINEQRRLRRAGRLHPERVRQLEALPGRWAWLIDNATRIG